MNKNLYDSIFYWYEQHVFENDGVWPRNVNLVFGFADWIESVPDTILSSMANAEDVNTVRKDLRLGVDTWIKENHKNIMGGNK